MEGDKQNPTLQRAVGECEQVLGLLDMAGRRAALVLLAGAILPSEDADAVRAALSRDK